MNRSFFGQFETLLKDDPAKKLSAAQGLIEAAKNEAPKPQKGQKDLTDKFKVDLVFGKDLPPIATYTLKRLITGSCSMVSDWQVSSAFPLKCLLNELPQIESQKFIENVLAVCDTKNAVKRSEVSHFIYGKQLCLFALIESGRLQSEKKCVELLQLICDVALSDMTNQPWAKELSINLILHGLQILKGTQLKTMLDYLGTKLKSQLRASAKPDSAIFRFILGIEELSKVNKLENPWGFHIENFHANIDELFQTILIEPSNEFPQKHSVTKAYIRYLVAQRDKDSFDKWLKFWKGFNRVLEGKDEAKDFKLCSAALKLLKQVLKQVEKTGFLGNAKELLDLLSNQTIISLWFKNLRSMNKANQKTAGKVEITLGKLVDILIKKSPPFKYSEDFLNVILKLKSIHHFVFSPRSVFSRAIVSALSKEGLSKLVSFLEEQATKEKNAHSYKYYLQELAGLASQHSENLTEEILLDAGYFLLKNTVLSETSVDLEAENAKDADKGREKPTKETLQQFAFEKFQSLLAHVNKRQVSTEDGVFSLIIEV